MREASSQFLPHCAAQGVRVVSSLPVSCAAVGRQWVRQSGLEVKLPGIWNTCVCVCVHVLVHRARYAKYNN